MSVTESFRYWALQDPAQPLVAERTETDAWNVCTYGEALLAVEAIGGSLLGLGLDAHHPLMILSSNSIDHLLMSLGAMSAGIPVAPVSVAYSLQSRDHARIRAIADLIDPGAVYADDGAVYGPALDALPHIRPVTSRGPRTGGETVAGLIAGTADQGMPWPDVGADTLAKILFTSGSTGTPKGVLTTHGMLAANQQMIKQAWPFLGEERPVIVDWLPWSHTFGGSHNVNMMLTGGGTIYIDDGRPAPELFARSIANLADVSPTIYFNVPAGYAQLVPALEQDAQFAKAFFARLRLMLTAGAALTQGLRDRLAVLAERTTGNTVPVTSTWGTTEMSPAATSAHFAYSDARCIGVPLPGAVLKLVPDDEDCYEIRVRGPMVTPGYFGQPELTEAAFDEEGFFRSGDAVTFIDSSDPGAGLVFRGRLAEDFKLATGTFVRVGALRIRLLSLAPFLSDLVIVGEDRDGVCALGWLNVTAADGLGIVTSCDAEVVVDPIATALLSSVLAEFNQSAGSASRIERIVILSRPPELESGEITDKGYVNQRRVLAQRTDQVELLYREPFAAGVISASAQL